MTDLRNLQNGDSVIYKNVGYGVVTYDLAEQDVVEIRDGQLYTKTFDRMEGMSWNEAQQCWKFDSGLGLITFAISADDSVALQWLKEEGE